MANRSLRRPYNGVARDAEPDAGADGSAEGIESQRAGRVENADSFVDGDGHLDESDIGNDSGSIGYVTVDPDNIGDFIANGGTNGNGDGSGRTRKPRSDAGKPRGTRAGKKKAAETVEPFIMMAHQWAAVFLKTPELMLDQSEAKQLSDAYSVFCQYHEIPVMSDKRMSEINLIGAIAMVYGPRILAVRNRVKTEKKQHRQPVPFTREQAQPIQ